jgi:predicted ester cyclase
MGEEMADGEKLVRGLFDAFNEQEWEKYDEVLADDVVVHESGEDMHGIEEMVEHDRQFQDQHPNATITVADSVASGERVAAREDISADGLEASGILFGRVENEKLAEIWVLTD